MISSEAVASVIANISMISVIRFAIILIILAIALYICVRISKKNKLYDTNLQNQMNG